DVLQRQGVDLEEVLVNQLDFFRGRPRQVDPDHVGTGLERGHLFPQALGVEPGTGVGRGVPAVGGDHDPLPKEGAAAGDGTGRRPLSSVAGRRTCGITSRASSSMLLRARSSGSVPLWQPVSTTPQPSSFCQWSSCCRTVSGLPTMAKTPFSTSSQ